MCMIREYGRGSRLREPSTLLLESVTLECLSGDAIRVGEEALLETEREIWEGDVSIARLIDEFEWFRREYAYRLV